MKKTPLPISEKMSKKRPPYTMPFKYFPDGDEGRWKKKGLYDIDTWLKTCTKKCLGEDFLLPQKSGRDAERIVEKWGTPFRAPYHRASLLEDKFHGNPAFIFCPGPTLGGADLDKFKGLLTIGVNSAGFKFKPYLWEMAECNYMNWFKHHPIPPDVSFLWNPRTAFRFQIAQLMIRNNPIKAAFIHKWEEERTIPPRNSAPSTTAALVAAWKLGCDSAYVVGMDLSKPSGQTYVEGVAVTQKGMDATFEWQLKSLRQFHIPGFKVYNASPFSQKEDLPFEPITYEEVEEVAAWASEVPTVETFIG